MGGLFGALLLVALLRALRAFLPPAPPSLVLARPG
jgi:hypothetical protein